MKLYNYIIILFISLVYACKTDKTITLSKNLQKTFPKAVITPIKIDDHFTEAYQIVFDQPLDHKHPEKGTFKHYAYLSHIDYTKPIVLITDGYASNNRTTELSKVLKGNQIIVEYRMYGKSRPDSIPWHYLTNDNAVEDYHKIVSKLKTIYKGKWLSSGISKGGETTLIYKSKYPNDVDVAVPYVAPLIDGLEDQRTNDLINSVGTETCRTAIQNFQRSILNNRTAILKELDDYAITKKMKFTEVSKEEALEYAVLEFPFSFWQWGGKCKAIPNSKASIKEQFNYLVEVSGFSLYNDWGYNYYLPSFYQHIRELGYYGFDLNPVKDLLQVVKNSSNKRFAPKNIDLTYDKNYIKEVRDFVENKGDNILYIYGEYDPWGACAPTPKANVDALKMVLKGGSHATRIKDFSPDEKKQIYNKLKKWLGEKTGLYQLN